MRLDPADENVALEFAFLSYETPEPVTFRVQARRIFDRLRLSGNRTAIEAFENVDRPLKEGIARWGEVVAQSPDNFSAHEELARLAEQRDAADLAVEHFAKALALRPGRRDLLLDMGRVWREQGRVVEANAVLLAASRSSALGAGPRVAEQAKALLPDRYPYVYEFENALALDPGNEELRRELAALHGKSRGC
jgi:thioredoxin-like negative regulator of GroEL